MERAVDALDDEKVGLSLHEVLELIPRRRRLQSSGRSRRVVSYEYDRTVLHPPVLDERRYVGLVGGIVSRSPARLVAAILYMEHDQRVSHIARLHRHPARRIGPVD